MKSLLTRVKKSLRLNNKGQMGGAFDSMAAIFIALVSVVVIVVVTMLIISQARSQIFTVEGLNGGNIGVNNDTVCQTSIACNATKSLRGSVNDAVSFVPLIVLALIGVVLLGLVALFRRRS